MLCPNRGKTSIFLRYQCGVPSFGPTPINPLTDRYETPDRVQDLFAPGCANLDGRQPLVGFSGSFPIFLDLRVWCNSAKSS